jgi:hypothetical protein
MKEIEFKKLMNFSSEEEKIKNILNILDLNPDNIKSLLSDYKDILLRIRSGKIKIEDEENIWIDEENSECFELYREKDGQLIAKKP